MQTEVLFDNELRSLMVKTVLMSGSASHIIVVQIFCFLTHEKTQQCIKKKKLSTVEIVLAQFLGEA